MRRRAADGVECLIGAVQSLRRRAGLSFVAGGATLVVVFVLGLSWMPEETREGRGSWWPLMATLLLSIGLCGAAILHRRSRARLTPSRLAPEADRAAGLGEGDVLAALELRPGPEPDAPSESLAGLHRRRVSARLSAIAIDSLLPLSAIRWRRRLVRAGVIIGIAATALVMSVVARPVATYSAAAALGAPWRTAFPASLPPLALRLETTRVARGTRARAVVHAPGRREVSLVWQVTGEPPAGRILIVGAGEEAHGETEALMAPLRVWAEDADGVASDTLQIRPLEPLLVEDLRATVTYPAYLGRGGEAHRGRIPPMVIPDGTRIALSGEANHPLEEGSLRFSTTGLTSGDPGSGMAVPLELEGSRFRVDLWPTTSGRWSWHLGSSEGIGAPILPEPLDLIVIPDARPSILLLFPAPDTLLGPDQVMPLVIDVEDDLGLLQAELAWWRSVPGGGPPPVRRAGLTPDPAGQKRAVFRPILDLRDEDLLPGDTVFYRIQATDGHPRRRPSRSETFLLRVPTLAEMRSARADESEELANDARQLAEAAEELERAAAEAERENLGQDPAEAGERAPGELDFEETENARAVLDQAEEMQAAVQSLQEDLEALQQGIEESLLSDPGLTEQLEQLVERYQELLEGGLAEDIEELSRALRDLDADAVQEALENMAGQAEWLREQIEQTLGLLEQAALDQAMKAAHAETDELAEAQRRALDGQDELTEEWATREERLADEAEALAQELEELGQRLEAAGQEVVGDSARVAGARADQAAEAMREAAEGASSPKESTAGAEGQASGEQGTGSQREEEARQAAEEAAEALEQAASALDGASEESTGGEDPVGALTRARTEALALSEAETDLSGAARGARSLDPGAWRARQSALRQGLDNLLTTLAEEGSRDGLLDREIGAAAGEAAEQMDRLLDQMTADGGRRLPSRSEAESIVDALNELAMRLLASERAAQAAQGEAGQEAAAEQMASLAQQQQGVTQRTSTLLVPGPRPAVEERAAQVAREQTEIAERLRELDDPDDELLGRPEELAQEAEALARGIEAGETNAETIERQRRLFRRMLDAGRSLEDEDLDPNRRESRTGRAAPWPPAEIDPALLRGARFPLPSEAVLRDLPLFYRQLIFDYFDRLNRDPTLTEERTTTPVKNREPSR